MFGLVRNWNTLLELADAFLETSIQPVVVDLTGSERAHYDRNKATLIMLGKLPSPSTANATTYRETMLHASAAELLEQLG